MVKKDENFCWTCFQTPTCCTVPVLDRNCRFDFCSTQGMGVVRGVLCIAFKMLSVLFSGRSSYWSLTTTPWWSCKRRCGDWDYLRNSKERPLVWQMRWRSTCSLVLKRENWGLWTSLEIAEMSNVNNMSYLIFQVFVEPHEWWSGKKCQEKDRGCGNDMHFLSTLSTYLEYDRMLVSFSDYFGNSARKCSLPIVTN